MDNQVNLVNDLSMLVRRLALDIRALLIQGVDDDGESIRLTRANDALDYLRRKGLSRALLRGSITEDLKATPQSSAPVVGEAMVAVAYRVCEDFIEKHGDGYLSELDDGQWNEMLRAALESALTGSGSSIHNVNDSNES